MKILLVEDSIDVSEPLLAYLAMCGYQTCLAHHATEALQLAPAFQPDLALLDIGLPAIDGWLLGGLLRALPGLADLPIIAITGHGGAADLQRSVDAKFQHHLVKPIDYDVLATIIKVHQPATDTPLPPPSIESASPAHPSDPAILKRPLPDVES